MSLCNLCGDEGTLTFIAVDGERKERLCPDCKGQSWTPTVRGTRLDKGGNMPRKPKKEWYEEWAELDAGAKVLVIAAFGFGLWLIYMFAVASMDLNSALNSAG